MQDKTTSPKKPKAIAHTPGPLARSARIRSDAARTAYVGLRRVLTTPWNVTRRRTARAQDPGRFKIDRETGFLLLPPGAVPHVDEVVTASRTALARFLASPESAVVANKPFLVNVLPGEALTLDSPWIRLALQPDLLAAVSAYLGIVPLLTSIQVFHSDVMTKAPKSSQLFHCDGDDVEQVKLFVLCSEVTPAGGPLTLMTASDSERVRRVTGYQYRQRLKDKEVTAAGGGATTEVIGPAGTSVLVDTSRCFHFGSRVQPNAPPRLMAMIQYQTPYSFMLPLVPTRVAPFRHLASADMRPLQRMVLGSE